MTTRAQMLARRWSSPVIVVTIDAIGEYAGLWRFCSRVPEYDPTNPRYLDWMTDYGLQLAEQVNPLGGVAEASELNVSLLDHEDRVTTVFRSEARPVTLLAADVTAAATTVELASGSGIAPGATVIFVASEAIRVDSLVSGTTYNVTRGALGTLAQAHRENDRVYLYTPHLYGRRVRMYTTFGDAGYSQAAELFGEVGGGWSLDGLSLEQGLNVWRIRSRSQLRFLDRLVMRHAYRGFIAEAMDERLRIESEVGTTQKRQISPQFQDRLFYRINGGEIIRIRNESRFYGSLTIDLRGAVGTEPEQLEVGDEIQQVFVADPTEGYGSFRYQAPGAETSSLLTGTWIVSSHPVVIILCLLTSSSSIGNFQPDNFGTNTGNYSCLTGGIGLGIPIVDTAAELDVASFLSVWQRTFSYRLDHFVLDEVRTGREVINEICRLCGYDLHTSNGRLRLDLHRSALAGEASITWDDDVLTAVEGEGEGVETLVLDWVLDTNLTAGSVIFHMRTARGVPVQGVFTDVDFPEVFGNTAGYYEQEDQRIEIDAPFVRADAEGAEPEIIRQRALQLLFRYRRPLARISIDTDLSHADVAVGSRVAITNGQVPDLANGVRGVTDRAGKILTKEVVVSEDFVGCRFTVLLDAADSRAGAICPSAMIGSVSVNDATIVANRYTDPASATLPASDAAAFTVGDRVRLVSRAGGPVATTPAFQTILTVTPASNLLGLDGNFGGSGSFAAGTVLEYVNRDDQVAQQHTRFVSMADAATRTVGSSTDRAWTISEP